MNTPVDLLTFKTCKLLVAAAWADGRLDQTEINALKELLFSLPELTAREWAALDIYIDSPVTSGEVEALLKDVIDHIRSEDDKRFVLNTLQRLLAIDGDVSEEEKGLFAGIRGAIEEKKTGIGAFFSRLGRKLLGRRQTVRKQAETRERAVEDFVRNKVLYDAGRSEALADISGDRLRKICAAAALLGRVAFADRSISPEEKETIASVLQESWGLTEAEARLLAEIVDRRVTEGMDYYHLGYSFFQSTTRDERKNFLKSLFQIANASGKTSLEKIEEIRSVAMLLKLSHSDFIEAKLTIPREDRRGL